MNSRLAVPVLSLLISTNALCATVFKRNFWEGHSPLLTYCFGSEQQASWGPGSSHSFILIPDEFIQFVETVLSQSYSENLTGVSFVPIGRCSDEDKEKTDLVIFLEEAASNQGSVGGSTWFPPSKLNRVIYRPTVRFSVPLLTNVRLPVKAQLKQAVLHEFGHIGGLAHEHLRPEAQDDPKCSRLKKGWRTDLDYLREILSEFHQAVGDYDADSIMNYCRVFDTLHNGKTEQIHLSEGDRSALRSLFLTKTNL